MSRAAGRGPASSHLYVLKLLGEDDATLRLFRLAPGEHLVGSLTGCEVPLSEKGVSRRHARLEVLADGGLLITDLGSKNGTTVNGITIRRAAVTDYAVVHFGPVATVIYAVDEAVDGMAIAASPAAGASSGEPGSAEDGQRSTQDLGLLRSLIESLRPLLVPLVERSASAEEAALRLARSWLDLLPVSRVELVRVRSGEEAVVATASRSAATAAEAKPRELRVAAHDWVLRLEAPGHVRLDRTRPFLEMALHLLAGRSRADPRSESVGEPVPPADAAEPPAPGTLDPEMKALYRRCRKVARGDIPLLILGESGTGKEVVARWIHERSRRAGAPFLAINCAALPRELLEAELFGIERGVATGVDARPGLLEQASGGTLFLDEIGDMPLETQAKVLRVLESTEVRRLGGRRPVAVDVRLVAATNRDLRTALADRTFRRDLYHRVAAFEVRLPPLRERKADVALLAAYFFHRQIARLGAASPGMTRGALAALLDYGWPGNVRELENEIAAAVLLLEPGEAFDRRHLSRRLRAAQPAERPLSLGEAVARAEREAVLIALAAADGHHGRAMELLGLARTTYYRKLKDLGLSS